MIIVRSANAVPIRLTEERWAHIVSRHPEMKGQKEKLLETLADADIVLEGDFGALLAVKHYESTPVTEKHMIAVYKEIDEADGYVLTAYFSRDVPVWRKETWKK